MRTADLAPVAVLCTVLLTVPANANAQGCFTGSGLALLVTAGRVEHAEPVEADGFGFGARLEWSPIPDVVARGSYQRGDLNDDQTLHTAAVGGAVRLPVPGSPCVTLDVLLSTAASLNQGDDHRNATLPLGIIFTRPLRWGGVVLTPAAGAHALFSATDARLLSFDIERQSWGYGAVAGARLEADRILTEFTVQATRLTSTVGPQPLGRFRADLTLGFRL